MRTKPIIIIIIINLIIVFTSFSQESDTLKKHEINLGYFNLLDLNQNHNFGIGYKFNLKKGAIRASFNLYLIEVKDNFFIMEPVYGKNIKLGYEFHNNLKKLQLFYGFEVILTKTFEQVDFNSLFTVHSEPYLRTEIQTLRLGTSPFVGLKFLTNKKISFSFETNMSILLQKTKIYYIEDIFSRDLRTSKTSIGIIPYSIITINFHL